ncbi:MAG: type IV pilus twitching motility protein PilT [Myxococcota bacterium]
MSDSPQPLLGRIAVHLKLISLDQLTEAMKLHGRGGGEKRLGDILIEQGMLTPAQLEKVLRARQQLILKQRAKQAGTAATAAAAPGREDADAAAPEAPCKAPAATRTTPPPVGPNAAGGPAGSDELRSLLAGCVEGGASDIHLHAGTPLRVRRHGRFESAGQAPLAPAATETMLRSALTAEQAQALETRGELDFAWTAPGLGRFRVNVYRQLHGLDGVFRTLPAEIPTLEALGLPGALAKFTSFHQGLVLVTGPAGCGKSSTLAALVDLINEERREHILTVEDPIEVLHPAKRCVVNQRTVGPHTESFARALRAALREDPDVIVIGELRDRETISLALTAAETGHLVLATLHTSSAIRTLNRIVGVFPADQHDQVRAMLSESMRAVISQCLVPAKDGEHRVPALEVLVNSKAVGNLIRENKAFQLHSILQMGAAQGMCLMDDSLGRLVKEGVIAREEALRRCEDSRRIP